MLTQKRLKELLSYDPATGLFTRLVTVGQRGLAGAVIAGYGTKYLSIGIDGKLYRAHRLAWLYMKGTFPPEDIDHKDGNGKNNKFANLRAATTAENMQNQRKIRSNSLSGIMGVNFKKRRGCWVARITINGKRRELGNFFTAAEAHAAYLAAKVEHHPFFTFIA